MVWSEKNNIFMSGCWDGKHELKHCVEKRSLRFFGPLYSPEFFTGKNSSGFRLIYKKKEDTKGDMKYD